MSTDKKDLGTIVVLKEGVELLHVVRKGSARVVIYRDSREGVYHWYDLEFLSGEEWKPVVTVGERNIGEAIDLFTEARQLVVGESKTSADSAAA